MRDAVSMRQRLDVRLPSTCSAYGQLQAQTMAAHVEPLGAASSDCSCCKNVSVTSLRLEQQDSPFLISYACSASHVARLMLTVLARVIFFLAFAASFPRKFKKNLLLVTGSTSQPSPIDPLIEGRGGERLSMSMRAGEFGIITMPPAQASSYLT